MHNNSLEERPRLREALRFPPSVNPAVEKVKQLSAKVEKSPAVEDFKVVMRQPSFLEKFFLGFAL